MVGVDKHIFLEAGCNGCYKANMKLKYLNYVLSSRRIEEYRWLYELLFRHVSRIRKHS